MCADAPVGALRDKCNSKVDDKCRESFCKCEDGWISNPTSGRS